MWKSIELKDFFDPKDYQFLKKKFLEIDTKNLRDDQKIIFSNKVFKNGTVQSSIINKEDLIYLNKKYTPKLLKILEEINPKKIRFYDYADFHLNICGKKYKHHIHEDDYRKLLSVVIFFLPEKNIGTNLYTSKNGDNKKRIKWETNKGLAFSRLEKETWHNYHSDGLNKRYTIVYNLQINEENRENRGNILMAENKFVYHYLIKNIYLFVIKLFLKLINIFGIKNYILKILKRN